MVELDAGERAVRLHEIRDSFKRRDVVVRPDAKIAVGAPDARINGGSFRENDSGAAQREPSQMNEMPVVRQAFLGGVLAHRRNDDAVSRRPAP